LSLVALIFSFFKTEPSKREVDYIQRVIYTVHRIDSEKQIMQRGGTKMSTYFSEKFKQLRKDKDLTQEQIADIFHVSSKCVSRWETGTNHPDVETLPHIAIYFQVTLDELLGTESIRSEGNVYEYTRDIRNLLNAGRFNDAIELARTATKEYPLNTTLHYLLVQALSVANETPKSKDKFKDEIIAISERIINLSEYETSLGQSVQLIRQYAKWNMKEDAKRLLDTLPTDIWNTQEPWIGLVLEGEEWHKNQQHRIIRARYLLEYLIGEFISKADLNTMQKIEYRKAKLQIESLIDTIAYDNAEDAVNHLELADEEIIITELYCEIGDRENALAYVGKATNNSMYHIEVMDKTGEDGGNYTAWETPRNLPWILWEDHLTKPVFDFVRNDERFIKCFELLKENSHELKS